MIVTVPEKLAYIRILVPKDLMDSAISKLQELGTLHIETLSKIPEEDRRRILSEVKKLEEVRKVVTALERYIEIPTLVRIREFLTPVTIRKRIYLLYEELRDVLKGVEMLSHKISDIEKELSNKEIMLKVLEVLSNYGLGDKTLDYLSYRGAIISSITLIGRPQAINEFKNIITKEGKERQVSIYTIKNYVIDENTHALILILDSKLLSIVDDYSRKLNLRVLKLPTMRISVNEYIRHLKPEIQVIEQEISKLRAKLRDTVRKNIDKLALIKAYIGVIDEQLKAIYSALMSKYLMGIEGWVPVSSMYLVENTLYNELKYVYIAKLSTDKKPPTKMRNPRPLKIFEMITKIYGIPNYDEWDPTPILAYSLMLFFGLMFADFIYGLALLIIVLFVLGKISLVENPYSEGYLSLKKMLIALSLSSMVFGILSNSFAGYSLIISNDRVSLVPLRTGPMQAAILPLLNPMFFIGLALIIGLIHVNIGHVLALIKYWRRRNLGDFTSKMGFFIAEVFGIPYILYVFLKLKLPGILGLHPEYLLYLALIGLGMLVAGKFMIYRWLALLFWLFDITGLLGDVMSYTRIAGIGLATTLLAQNFNSLALGLASSLSSLVSIKIVGLALGAILSIIIMLFANLLNLAFGVLGAFIHSLRLCFVEFLPKFYEGEGREFKPFAVKVERAIMVGRTQ